MKYDFYNFILGAVIPVLIVGFIGFGIYQWQTYFLLACFLLLSAAGNHLGKESLKEKARRHQAATEKLKSVSQPELTEKVELCHCGHSVNLHTPSGLCMVTDCRCAETKNRNR